MDLEILTREIVKERTNGLASKVTLRVPLEEYEEPAEFLFGIVYTRRIPLHPSRQDAEKNSFQSINETEMVYRGDSGKFYVARYDLDSVSTEIQKNSKILGVLDMRPLMFSDSTFGRENQVLFACEMYKSFLEVLQSGQPDNEKQYAFNFFNELFQRTYSVISPVMHSKMDKKTKDKLNNVIRVSQQILKQDPVAGKYIEMARSRLPNTYVKPSVMVNVLSLYAGNTRN